MFDTVDRLTNPKRKIKTETIASIDGVTAVLSVFELTETGESAYGVRLFRGDPENGPYHSAITELYYQLNHALLETISIATSSFSIASSVWSQVVGLEAQAAS